MRNLSRETAQFVHTTRTCSTLIFLVQKKWLLWSNRGLRSRRHFQQPYSAGSMVPTNLKTFFVPIVDTVPPEVALEYWTSTSIKRRSLRNLQSSLKGAFPDWIRVYTRVKTRRIAAMLWPFHALDISFFLILQDKTNMDIFTSHVWTDQVVMISRLTGIDWDDTVFGLESY